MCRCMLCVGVLFCNLGAFTTCQQSRRHVLGALGRGRRILIFSYLGSAMFMSPTSVLILSFLFFDT